MGSKTKQLTVRDLMQKKVFTAQPNQTVFSVSVLMASKNVGALPVVKEDGTFVGIITDRDIITRCNALGKDPNKTVFLKMFILMLINDLINSCLSENCFLSLLPFWF